MHPETPTRLPTDITALLVKVREGDAAASDELIPAIYGELHRIASQRLRHDRPNHTLRPTALVNEAYLKIFGKTSPQFADRAHFMAFASRIMRGILVDYARNRAAVKRGGDALPVDTEIAVDDSTSLLRLLDLDTALNALDKENHAAAEVIEMRYFGGMTAEETATVVGRSIHVVQHELRFAHAWLRHTLAHHA